LQSERMNCGRIRESHMDAISSIGARPSKRSWTVWDLPRWLAPQVQSLCLVVEERNGSNEMDVFPSLGPSLHANRRNDVVVASFSDCRYRTPLRGHRAVDPSAKSTTTGLSSPASVAMGAAPCAGPDPGIPSPTARCYAGNNVCPLTQADNVGQSCTCGTTMGRALIPPSHDISGRPLSAN
jgi:hypothetical protein